MRLGSGLTGTAAAETTQERPAIALGISLLVGNAALLAASSSDII